MMKGHVKSLTLVTLVLTLYACSTPQKDHWTEDFKYQPVSMRPGLEVNYTDSSRTAFNVLAQDYRLVG